MLRSWLTIVALLAGIGLSSAAQSNTTLKADPRWEQGRKHLAAGKAAEASAVFDELIKLYPGEADLHLFQAIALLRLRQPQAAELNVKRAVAADPNHVEARTLLGWIESEVRGDFDAAIRDYQRVVELRPDLPEAYNNLGVAQKKKGELTRAADNFNRALALKADYGAALSNRGWVFAEQHRWTEARRDFEQALKLNPADDGALYGLSQALREVRDYSAAQQALGRLTSRSPNFVYWLEWGRIGLIRYYWVLLAIAIGLFIRGRFNQKARTVNGG
jgi:tetratricopeptide (TPR) repeat protein